MSSYSPVFDSESRLQVRELPEGLVALCRDEEGNTVWRPLEDLVRHSGEPGAATDPVPAPVSLQAEKPPKWGWKVFVGWLLGGGAGAALAPSVVSWADNGEVGPALIAAGEVAGVIAAIVWWRIEYAQWERRRDQREAHARWLEKQTLFHAQQAEDAVNADGSAQS